MSHKILKPFIVKVSVLGYFPLYINIIKYEYYIFKTDFTYNLYNNYKLFNCVLNIF